MGTGEIPAMTSAERFRLLVPLLILKYTGSKESPGVID